MKAKNSREDWTWALGWILLYARPSKNEMGYPIRTTGAAAMREKGMDALGDYGAMLLCWSGSVFRIVHNMPRVRTLEDMV